MIAGPHVASNHIASNHIAGIRTASLGMYDLPWLAAATDAFWAALRDWLRGAGLADVPQALDRDRPLAAIWHDPGLLLAQTCGFPLVTTLTGVVRVVATPCYDLPGCDGPGYCSFVVVAAASAARSMADLRGSRVAINGHDSQSGMNTLRALVARWRWAAGSLVRWRSPAAICAAWRRCRPGRPDVAAIDCVSYGLVAAEHPEWLHGTRVLCRTPAAPGLPYVTAAATPDAVVALLRDALDAVAADRSLHLSGFARLTAADYAPILAMRDVAAQLGYPELG